MTGCVYTQYSHALSRVAQRKRAGPITQRSVDRNHPLLRTHFSRILRFLFFTVENGACPGVEPGTSRTRSANHTTRPTGHGIHYINKGRKTWVTVMASDINMIPVTIHETKYMNIVFRLMSIKYLQYQISPWKCKIPWQPIGILSPARANTGRGGRVVKAMDC